MEVKSNFEIYLKNLILPTLFKQIEILESKEDSAFNISQEIIQFSRLDDDDTQIKNSRLKIIKILGMKVFNEIYTTNMNDWRKIMFEDEFVFENISSIEECVINICRTNFMKKLKFIFKYLVEFYGISNILTLQNLPSDCSETLEMIFIENLNQFMTISM
jgi:hypothetical protein